MTHFEVNIQDEYQVKSKQNQTQSCEGFSLQNDSRTPILSLELNNVLDTL